MAVSFGPDVSGRVGGRAVVALTCALLALALGLAPAGARAARDSGRVVPRVRIGPAGIRIEPRGRADSTAGAQVEIRQDGKRVLAVESSADESGGGHGSAVTVRSGEAGHAGSIVVDAGDDALVRLFADASVPAGETFPGDVVAVFGSADVAGTVEGDVVAVLGSVHLHPGARVEGDAVAVGGALDQPAGAEVGGQSIAIGGLLPGWHVPTTTLLLVAALTGWLATLLMAGLLSLLFPGPMLRIGSAASRHSAGSFFLGLVSAPFLLLVVAFVVMAAAVVGAALAVPLLFLGLLLPWVGQVAATYVLGCRLMRRRPGESGLMAPVFVGSLLVALLFLSAVALSVPSGLARSLSLFFATLGMLLVAVLATLGTGAMLISLMGTRPAASPAPGTSSPPQA
jgi:hypothetical protein